VIKYNVDGHTINPTCIVAYKWRQATKAAPHESALIKRAGRDSSLRVVGVGSWKVGKVFVVPDRTEDQQSLRLSWTVLPSQGHRLVRVDFTFPPL
jgi:hypothetical protein